MARRLPPLNAVRAFESAGRHVSFTKAAAELNVTHGAVSRQVALLEQWLGAPLFRRNASQLTLTDAGRAYLAELTAVLDRLAIASMHLAGAVAPIALQVNAPPTFTMRWLIPRLSTFQRQRPEIEVRLTTSLAPVNFQEHNYDVAIRGAQAPLPGALSKPFMTELIVPVCHVDLIDKGSLRTPADLAAHPQISYATEPYAWVDWSRAAGADAVRPASTLKFEQMFFALQAAAEGLGVVLVPLFLAIEEILAGRLATPFGLLAAKRRRYYATAVERTPPIEDFVDWLLREGRETERMIADWAQEAGWEEGGAELSRRSPSRAGTSRG